MSVEPRRVAIIGAGNIGIGLAIVFARAGWQVGLHDNDPAAAVRLRDGLAERLSLLSEYDLMPEERDVVVGRIRLAGALGAAVEGAELVLECLPEILDLKTEVLRELDEIADDAVVIGSTTSAFPPSSLGVGLPDPGRLIVLHPANPPYLIDVVEVVPSPDTRPDVVHRAQEMLTEVGMAPIHVSGEPAGFAYNRLQGAVLREAYCLVRDGVISVEELDTLVRDGLALRWSVVGPFETADLNYRGGIAAHAARMGPAYERMGAERGQHDPWTDDLVAEVTRQRRELLDLDSWDERVMWRDRALAGLKRHQKSMVNPQ